jgi:hypothetical protein
MPKAVMVACGSNTGKTVVIQGKQFVNGEYAIQAATQQDTDYQVRFVNRTCNAYLRGSPELAEAQARDESRGIQHNASTTSAHGNTESVQGGVGESAGKVSASSAAFGTGFEPLVASDGSAGMVPGGDGHADSGLRPGQVGAIRTALFSLDPLNDQQWTDAGLPAIEAMVTVMNDQSINRGMIEAVEPGFDRDKALERAAARNEEI